jgi:hypothetical protein
MALGFPFAGEPAGVVVWDLCFWFPGCTDHACIGPCGLCVWGVWYGVVV